MPLLFFTASVCFTRLKRITKARLPVNAPPSTRCCRFRYFERAFLLGFVNYHLSDVCLLGSVRRVDIKKEYWPSLGISVYILMAT